MACLWHLTSVLLRAFPWQNLIPAFLVNMHLPTSSTGLFSGHVVTFSLPFHPYPSCVLAICHSGKRGWGGEREIDADRDKKRHRECTQNTILEPLLAIFNHIQLFP
jgi:hypothetical protein